MLLHCCGYISRCRCKVECVDPDIATKLCKDLDVVTML